MQNRYRIKGIISLRKFKFCYFLCNTYHVFQVSLISFKQCVLEVLVAVCRANGNSLVEVCSRDQTEPGL